MYCRVGDFGEETCERDKVYRGLVEGIGDMGWIDVGDKACSICKWERIEVPVRKTMHGGMIDPFVGGRLDGMMMCGMEAWGGEGVVEWHTGWIEGDCVQGPVEHIGRWRKGECSARRGWCHGGREVILGGPGRSGRRRRHQRCEC